MWLYNALPKKHLAEKHKFTPTQEWQTFDVIQRARERRRILFVHLHTGLVLTNHHVASDTLYNKLSTPERNINSDGYYAKTQADELKAPDLELNQLVSIEDVTDRVNAAVKPGLSAADANKERQKAMSEIEQASKDKTGACAATLSRCMAALVITCIATRLTPTCVWSGHRKRARLSSLAMRITLSIHAIVWT